MKEEGRAGMRSRSRLRRGVGVVVGVGAVMCEVR